MGFQLGEQAGPGRHPGDEPDFFTLGKAFPDTQPLRIKKGDVIRIRLIGAGDEMHSIHIHGHDFEVYAKDGRPLANPYPADTILLGPGERYDLILRADNPAIWMVHDHIDRHTVNGKSPMGGIMTTIEYAEIPVKEQAFYTWKNKNFVPDFIYEELLKKSLGMHENPRLQRCSGTLTPCFQGDKYEKAAVGSWIGGGLCRRCMRGQRS